MFHAIKTCLDRLRRRIDARLAIPFEYAAFHGWEARQVSRGTWAFRDPRFRQLAVDRTTSAPGEPAARSWAQDAIAGRIRALPADPGTETAGRTARRRPS